MRNVYNDKYSEQREFEQKESTVGAILRMMLWIQKMEENNTCNCLFLRNTLMN